MIVVRFKVKCKPEKTERAMAAFREVVAASRPLDGVVSFDMGRDITDPDSFIALEVFEDREALERQESLAAVQTTLRLLEEALAAEPEATISTSPPRSRGEPEEAAPRPQHCWRAITWAEPRGRRNPPRHRSTMWAAERPPPPTRPPIELRRKVFRGARMQDLSPGAAIGRLWAGTACEYRL